MNIRHGERNEEGDEHAEVTILCLKVRYSGSYLKENYLMVSFLSVVSFLSFFVVIFLLFFFYLLSLVNVVCSLAC